MSEPESCFLTVNGLKLQHLDWGNPDAPILLCVHGFRGTAHAFDGFARHFSDRFHVISVDVRGRGDSDWSPEGRYTYEDYVSDFEGVVDGLGLDRFTLVGTSMGGIISMVYASRHASRLERLVINDIGPDEESGSARITGEAAAIPESFGDLEEALEYFRRTFPPRAQLPAEEQRSMALSQIRQATDGRYVWKMDLTVTKQRAEQGSPKRPDLWPALQQLPCPTLVVWGTISDVLSEAQAQRMVDTLPRGSLAAVAGVAHAPNLTEPDAMAALEQFLA